MRPRGHILSNRNDADDTGLCQKESLLLYLCWTSHKQGIGGVEEMKCSHCDSELEKNRPCSIYDTCPEIQKEKCDCMIGWGSAGAEEDEHVYLNRNPYHFTKEEFFAGHLSQRIKFNFCPLCGREL